MDTVLCGICAPSGAENYQREIRQFLWSHRSEKETDLVIISGGKSFNVHQVVILPLSSYLTQLLPPSCPCTKPAICLPPFPSHVLTAAIEILYTGTTTVATSQRDQVQVEEVLALLEIKGDVDKDLNIEANKEKVFKQVEEDLEAMFADLEDSDTEKQFKNKMNSKLSTGTMSEEAVPKSEPTDFLEIPDIEQQTSPPHKDIHSCYLDEVTGAFYKNERESVSRLDELKSCQSQGQTAPAMILNEATGVFCYDVKKNISGLNEIKINNRENDEIVTKKVDNNESLKKNEYDITKPPKQDTKLYAFGSKEEHPSISSQKTKLRARKRKAKEPDEIRKRIKLNTNLPSSVSKLYPDNKKLEVTGLDVSTRPSVIKLKPGIAKQSSSKLACSKCDYTTTWKRSLKIHIDCVHKNSLHKCDDCDYTTNIKENLKKHNNGVHKKTLYNCNECDYTSAWKSSLKRHIDGGVHNKILYNCNECDYTTKWKRSFKRHIDGGVHKKIMYNCNLCDYTTTWKSSLKMHINGVHKNSLCKCDDCDYTTNVKKDLKRHIDGVHKKRLYNCNECDYTTTWKLSLRRHIAGVHKNILYKCGDCDYTAKQKDNFKRHIDSVHKKPQTEPVDKPVVPSRKSVRGEVTAKCHARSQKMSPDVAATANSNFSVFENHGANNDKAEQKQFEKKSKTNGDADLLW